MGADVNQATPRNGRVATARLIRLPAALVAALAMTLSLAVPTVALDTERVVVTASHSVSAAASAVLAEGGRVLETLDPFGLIVATVPADRVDDLAADPATAGVTADVPMHVQSADFADGDTEAAAASAAADAGAGVGVVIVDTGVDASHPALDEGKVVAAIDLTDENDGTDHHGHGTFLAGLVAGDADVEHTGVAPGSHIVSVKVAGADGSTTLSAVLQGLVAADRAREQFDAPVVLLALSGPVGTTLDPIMFTLEMLWARGSTVVVAAGNTGSAPGSVGSPGADPYILTVGALDESGVVAEFSSRGPNPWGHTKPDLAAPGVKIVGPRVVGSTIDMAYPHAVQGEDWFRGSGTSMSAALTAGAAAAVIAGEQTLTPDAVKGRLMGSATPVADAGPNDAGAGALDLGAALTSTAGPANTDLPPLPEPFVAPGNGGNAKDWADRPGNGRKPVPGVNGNPNAAGWSWGGWSWGGWSWGGWSWGGWSWGNWDWDDASYWNGWSWGGWSWGGWSWAGEGAGWSWAGEGAPAGWSWAGEGAGWSWAGEGAPAGWSWAGWSWSGWSWSGWSWSGWSWSTASWG